MPAAEYAIVSVAVEMHLKGRKDETPFCFLAGWRLVSSILGTR
jgi:hypothetical protein